jgi:hypothetical protein
MFAILHVLWIFVVDIFKSRRRLEAENLFLHDQLNIALRRASPRLRLYGSDRALLVWMTRIRPGLLDISRVVKPETILRWHRSGFKAPLVMVRAGREFSNWLAAGPLSLCET